MRVTALTDSRARAYLRTSHHSSSARILIQGPRAIAVESASEYGSVMRATRKAKHEDPGSSVLPEVTHLFGTESFDFFQCTFVLLELLAGLREFALSS